MNISVCTTVFNEEDNISKLLDSLLVQSKKPAEIVIVDGGSTDKTVEIIRHYQKKDNRIKLLVEKCSRSRGRNLGVEIAKNEIIAMTDAGCVACPDWLMKLVEPFNIEIFSSQPHFDPGSYRHEFSKKKYSSIGVVAGFYSMTALNAASKAMSVFMGVQPDDFDVSFLPSTRSTAFKKSVWEKIGGFPENITDTAEDTVFNYKLIKNGVKIVRVKNAIVEWGMPETIINFQLSIFNYAKGDAKSGIWNFPGKTLTSHNIHSLSIVFRYVFAISLLVFSFVYPFLLTYLTIFLLIYFVWSFRKIYSRFREVKVALWGPVLQLVSDLSVIAGFWSGIFNKNA